MPDRASYEIVYAREAVADLRAFRAFDQRIVLNGVEQYLAYEPARASKTRIKRMIQPFWSQYRLRLNDLRVYYDVDESAQRVNVLRILKKTTGTTPTESP